MPPKKILSYWTYQYGIWDGQQLEYINKYESTETVREIEMRVGNGKYGPVLIFSGGPTGFERYYIHTLRNNPKVDAERFVICAGTINSWPRVWVPWQEVLAFIS